MRERCSFEPGTRKAFFVLSTLVFTPTVHSDSAVLNLRFPGPFWRKCASQGVSFTFRACFPQILGRKVNEFHSGLSEACSKVRAHTLTHAWHTLVHAQFVGKLKKGVNINHVLPEVDNLSVFSALSLSIPCSHFTFRPCWAGGYPWRLRTNAVGVLQSEWCVCTFGCSWGWATD